nr:retrotransposon protein, putative, Ty1-copia subclass [Tanacetum cinerariifolium]
MLDLVPNVNSIYNVSTKRAKHNLDSTYLWHRHLAHISKKRIEKRKQEGLLKSIDDESFDQCISCLSRKMTRKSFPHRLERATDLFGIIHTDVCGPHRYVSRQGDSYFITFADDYSRYGYVYLLKHKHEDYTLECATSILNMVPTNKVNKTPYELWYGEVPNLSYLKVWGCEALVKRNTLDKLQQRSINKIPMEVKGFEPPQEEMILIRRSESTHRAPNRLYLNVEVEEHNLGDLNEPASYKAAIDRSKRLIGLGQNAYMDKILKRYKMDNSKRRHIPMQERLDFNKTQGASTLKVVKCMQKVPYALAVGFIMYGGVADSVNKGGDKGFAWRLRVQGGDNEASMVVTRC